MEILHREADYVICRKQPGEDSEHDLPAALQEALGMQAYPVHRLDQNVGGLMVFALTRQAAARFGALAETGALEKEYVALVHGTPPARGDWEDLLFKDSRKNKVFCVKKERRGVRRARLEYRVLKAGERSLVRVHLHTGRSHQIRVQFSSRGFPLVGDHKYGSRAKETAPMLYSCCLAFPWRGTSRRYEDLPAWAEG